MFRPFLTVRNHERSIIYEKTSYYARMYMQMDIVRYIHLTKGCIL